MTRRPGHPDPLTDRTDADRERVEHETDEARREAHAATLVYGTPVVWTDALGRPQIGTVLGRSSHPDFVRIVTEHGRTRLLDAAHVRIVR